MAKPIKQRDKWRIRWFDENGIRRSEVFDDYRTAQQELSKREAEATEVREGLRSPRSPAALLLTCVQRSPIFGGGRSASRRSTCS